MVLKAVIIEDEKHGRETLKSMLEEFCKDVQVIAMAGSVEEAVKVLSIYSPDIVFLDIELQSGVGFDVLNQIKEPSFEVIFTTAFEKYAIKAIKFSSLDYLLKPIDLDELQEAVEKARTRMDTNIYREQLDTLMESISQGNIRPEKICLATTAGMEFIAIDDIIACKANGSYTSFILEDNNNLLVSKHLKEYENLLSEHQFMRVHNSHLINLKKVKKYIKSDGGYLIMSNDLQVNISSRKKDDLIEAMKRL
ncbi:MAG: LytTR family DNA-binding domain-containing protein [Bacteroidota bacterium]|uniref:Response regulator transcription factor n=1 Tax=Flagellimonas profundi TaxID=2915620 RepID=A0ABS3FI83_9FLAO|nr:LytTR family DNA-binding domain-containing protein [Allomuricauda profundi]MBO0342430.1 response regulator transcription factor [Allomuricauda profundi]MEC7770866.1 LytTR family DNA-binding domain-containing protein [Bacteroidota bacterium]